jgi:maleate isomerase
MWQSDGLGWRARIGLLVAHLDVAPESEFQAMAPAGVSLHAARVPLGVVGPSGEIASKAGPEAVRAFAESPLLDSAAELLAAARLHAIVYAFTSSSYLLGAEADAALKVRLEQRTGGVPVVIACASAVLALRASQVRRLALISPPWFPAELDAMGADYFRGQGFDVVYSSPAAVRSGFGEVYPAQLYEWVRTHVPPAAEAVYVGGTGFRAIGAIRVLEEDLGVPVLTANQAALWHALRLAGVRAPVAGYGQVFAHELPT